MSILPEFFYERILIMSAITLQLLGDSITQGAGASAPDKCYAALLESQWGYHVINGGIGGTRIARQTHPSEISEYDLDFCMRADQLDGNADAVVIFGGVNDWGHGDAPLGNPWDRDVYTFYGALHLLYETICLKYIGKPILVVTPLRTCGDEKANAPGKAPLLAYRSAILEVALRFSLPVLDLYATGSFQPEYPEVREKLMPDGLHPSDEGHAILARRIHRALSLL